MESGPSLTALEQGYLELYDLAELNGALLEQLSSNPRETKQPGPPIAAAEIVRTPRRIVSQQVALSALKQGYLELHDSAELNYALQEQLTSSPRESVQPGPLVAEAENEPILQDPLASTTIDHPTPAGIHIDYVWLHNLRDRCSEPRKQITVLLSNVLFGRTPLDEAALHRDLLQICLGDPQLLYAMLRTPFMDGGQTPLGWTIANSPGNLLGNLGSYSAIVLPNMLRTLRTWSVRGLGLDSKAATKDLYDSVAESCCKVNNNSLYQYFNPSAQPIPNVLGSNYRMQLSGKAVFRFDIYKFDTQMSTERKIDLRLLFLGKILSISLAAPDTAWVLSWKIIAERYEEKLTVPFHRYKVVQFVLRNPSSPDKEVRRLNLDISWMSKSCPARSTSAALLQNSMNDFVGYGGQVYGYIRFCKR